MTRFTKSLLLLAAALNCCNAGQLTGNFVSLPSPSSVNLSVEGSLDWAHWGLTSPTDFNHLAATNQFISIFTVIGSQFPARANSLPVGCSWTNGTPVATATGTTTGVYVSGISNGFQLTITASTSPRRLRLYVGILAGRARFEAALSDGSAASYLDFSLDSVGLTNGVYVLDFASASPGQNLILKLTLDEAYDVSAATVLQAATLAINPNVPPVVNLTTPLNDTNYLLGASIPLSATATDPDGNLAQVEFFDGNNSLARVTNSPYQFDWTNATPGFHALTAVASDTLGASNVSETVTVFIYTGLGLMTSTVAAPTNSINLSSEGIADWAHWGLLTEASFDHKAGVLQQLANYTLAGNGPAYNFSDNLEGYSWSGGTPTPIATDTHSGVYAAGTGEGFQITAAADTTVKTLKLYVGTFGARGQLQAYLSDFSAPIYFDESLQNAGNGPSGVYTINYRAASAGQQLVLRFTVAATYDQFGNVTLQAATLVGANNPPFASIISPTNQAAVTAPANVTIHAQASDSDGTIAKLEFFQGATKLGELTNSPYDFTWTNIPPGNYSLTVRATDDQNATFTSAPINLYVINGGGFLSGRLAMSPAAANLSVEGILDWGHWGLVRANSFNHKLGGTQINDVTILGGGNPGRYTDNGVKFSWTNGTPVLAASDSPTGILETGLGNGFQFTVPADAKPKRLKIYLGLFAARGRVEATLSDFSSVPFADESLTNLFGNSYGVYTLDFAAASAGKALTVKYTAAEIFNADFGNVTWQAATLHLPLILLRNPQISNGQFSFLVTSEVAATHVIEYATALSGPWSKLTNFVWSGTDMPITDPEPASATRFYRVRTE